MKGNLFHGDNTISTIWWHNMIRNNARDLIHKVRKLTPRHSFDAVKKNRQNMMGRGAQNCRK